MEDIRTHSTPYHKRFFKRLKIHLSEYFALILAVMSVFALAGTISVNHRLNDKVKCQASVNAQLISTLNARSQAVDKQDDAFANMMNTLVDPTKTQAERAAAFNHFNQVVQDGKKQRSDNPFPPPPKETCG